MFYQGNLQEGIAVAVSQSKAVVCFVRDDEELSNVWENEYLADDPTFAQLFVEEAITLRLPVGSEGATYLTSFCPIPKLPGLVVIRDGMMREYIIPEISKEDFRARLRAVLEDGGKSSQAPQQTQTDAGGSSAAAPAEPTSDPALAAQLTPPAPQIAQSQSQPAPATNDTKTPRDGNKRAEKPSAQKPEPPKRATPSKTPSQTSQQQQESHINQTKQLNKKAPQPRKAAPGGPSTTSKTSDTEVHPKPTPTVPKQYRLQIRLFDGSSVRSSFDPSQIIRKDVRPWLDDQMDEKHPFNLKHILTPLPNRTLTIADEEQTLQEYLGLGATANLVMVPIQSYTEAYTGSDSLPVRAVSSAYDLATSTVGAAAGYVGSWLGYGQTTASEGSSATEPSASGDARRTASRPAGSRGPNIRTLADQRREQGNNQFYNGNQLNFQPRENSDQR